MDLEGKVIVVTGAAHGIGRALVERFARERPRALVLSDIDAGELAALASRVDGRAVVADVAVEADVRRLVDAALTEHGQVDLFCSNAGISVHGGAEVSNEAWRRIMEVNVMAHVYAARALLPSMLARKSGYLLNTASAAGLLASMGSAPYGVTKHAAVALAEHLAIQYGDRGICVSVLCPQAVDTNMLRMAGAGAASVDGVLHTDAVAQTVIEAMDEERFLILTHPEVKEYMARKLDRDRWLRGMRRLRDRTGEGQKKTG